MSHRPKSTIQLQGSIGAHAQPMDLNLLQTTATVAGDYYCAAGTNPPSTTASTMATNGATVLVSRNYTITGWNARSHTNADDANETFTLYINGVASTVIPGIPNGTNVGSATGLSVAVSAGDELCYLLNALSDGSFGKISISLHLEPR